LENPAGQWHAVLSLDAGGVIFEVKQGAYQPMAAADQAPWSPEPDTPEAAALVQRYASAQPGDRLF
ncbi:MAG: hypothetical protein RIR00_1736, partial [Pseudomonadota bacterium]